MTSVQLTVPFVSTLKLTEKHKCTLIASQAKRIGIEEWEISSLTQLCKAKGWISRGLALLYKYAGHIDELQELLSLFHFHYEEIINYSYLDIIQTLGRISIIVIRIYFSLCGWRKIQFSPRVLYIIENGQRSSISRYLARKMKSILENIRQHSQSILADLNSSLLREIIVNVLGEEILQLHEEMDLSSYDWLSSPSSSSNSKYFIKLALLRIMEAEESITAKWEEVGEVWPVSASLLLPYPEVKRSLSEMAWFTKMIDAYQKVLDQLGSVIEECLLIHSTMSQLDQVRSVLYSLQDERFRAYWKSSQNEDGNEEINDIFRIIPASSYVVLLQGLNPLVYSFPYNSSKPTRSPLSSSAVSPNNFQKMKLLDRRHSLNSEDSSLDGDHRVRKLETNRTEESVATTENLVTNSNPTLPTRAKHPVNNNSAISLHSTESTITNALFSPKLISVRDQTASLPSGETVSDSVPSSNTTPEEAVKDSPSPPLATIEEETKKSSSSIPVSPTARSVESRAARTESTAVVKIPSEEDRIITVSSSPPHRLNSIDEDRPLSDTPLPPSQLVKLNSVEAPDQSSEILYYTEEEQAQVFKGRAVTTGDISFSSSPPQRSFAVENRSDYDDDFNYPPASLLPSTRSRAQSAGESNHFYNDHESHFHADDRNFFNRERIVSDPRGLSVDRYMRSYQVHYRGRKTRKSNNQRETQVFHYGKLKRADFTFTALATALKSVDNEMSLLAQQHKDNIDFVVRKIAAKKISVWYMIMSPRRKLLKRLLHRNMILDIVHSLVDQAANIALIRSRRREQMLRTGAAIRVQKVYRGWVHKIQEEEAKIEREERKQIADHYLGLWIRAVKGGIRVYRYIRYLVKKKIIRKSAVPPSPMGSPLLRRGRSHQSQSSPVSLPKILEAYLVAVVVHRKFDLKMQLQRNNLIKLNATDPAAAHGKRVRIFQEFGAAIILIQSAVRRYIQRKRYYAMKYNSALVSRLAIFLSRSLRYRRRRKLELINNAAVKIQRFVRGIIIRRKLFRIVHSGLKLNFMWRKYVAYKSLKAQLRRIDRPYTIILHGLRDLPKKYLTSDQIRFKISVWWHPLLHIVSKNDFNVILQSKQPQYIYLSNSFKIMDNAPITVAHHRHSNPDNSGNPTGPEDTQRQESHQSKDLVGYPSGAVLPRSGLNRFNHFFQSLGRISRPLIAGRGAGATPRPTSATPFQSGFLRFTKKSLTPPPTESRERNKDSVEARDSDSTLEPSPSVTSAPPTSVPTTTAPPITAARRKSSNKKRSLRMSQGALPPSSLLQLALTEEDEEEDEDEEDDEEDDEKEQDEEYNTNHSKRQPPSSASSRRSTELRGSRKSVVRSPFLSAHSSASQSGERLDSPKSDRERTPPPNASVSPLKSVPSISSNSESENDTSDTWTAGGNNRSRTASIMETFQSTFAGRQHLYQRSDDPSTEKGESEELKPAASSRRGTAESKRSSFLFSNLPSARSTRASVVRSTINFALRLRSMVQKSHAQTVKLDCMCNFEETVVKIPGCHGNSVFKFEILEGERKISHCFFYLGKEGEMMFWGGEYQLEMRTVAPQRRGAHSNRMSAEEIAKMGARRSSNAEVSHEPKIDFRVIAGAPLRSKCQWARVIVRGKGPLRRTINNRDFMNSFNLFDHWTRFYLSLDQFGLHLFENKFLSTAFFTIPIDDFKTIRVELGFPIRESMWSVQSGVEMVSRLVSGGASGGRSGERGVAKPMSRLSAGGGGLLGAASAMVGVGGTGGEADRSILEDIHNVILTTSLGDELYMRFPDTSSRNAWHEVFSNAILYTNNVKSCNSQANNTFSWLSGAFRSPKKMKKLEEERKDVMNRKVIFASRSKSRNKAH